MSLAIRFLRSSSLSSLEEDSTFFFFAAGRGGGESVSDDGALERDFDCTGAGDLDLEGSGGELRMFEDADAAATVTGDLIFAAGSLSSESSVAESSARTGLGELTEGLREVKGEEDGEDGFGGVFSKFDSSFEDRQHVSKLWEEVTRRLLYTEK